VIEELLQLREKCRLIPLMGNHEEMMLNFLDGRPQPDSWLLCGGDATLRSPTSQLSVQIQCELETAAANARHWLTGGARVAARFAAKVTPS
jgi:hypothetical protein